VHPRGGDAGVGGAVGDEHAGRHAAAVRSPLCLRRVPLRPQVCRHAGDGAGGSAAAVEQGALAVPAQDRLRPRQDLPLSSTPWYALKSHFQLSLQPKLVLICLLLVRLSVVDTYVPGHISCV
jgi:hypothetical protein